MLKVLIVEDDRNLAAAISRALVTSDFDPDIAYTGTDGLAMGERGTYDVILLDLMLPGIDGLEICKSLKEQGVQTPVIMVTARAAIPDRISGFEAGADDYLPKPFSPAELIARIHAVTRRTGGTLAPGKTKYGDLEYSADTGELAVGSERVVLSEKERLIMSELMREPGAVCSKESLLQAAWGDDPDADMNNVEAYVSFLRKKLRFVGTTVQIKTLRKIGYRIELAD